MRDPPWDDVNIGFDGKAWPARRTDGLQRERQATGDNSASVIDSGSSSNHPELLMGIIFARSKLK